LPLHRTACGAGNGRRQRPRVGERAGHGQGRPGRRRGRIGRPGRWRCSDLRQTDSDRQVPTHRAGLWFLRGVRMSPGQLGEGRGPSWQVKPLGTETFQCPLFRQPILHPHPLGNHSQSRFSGFRVKRGSTFVIPRSAAVAHHVVAEMVVARERTTPRSLTCRGRRCAWPRSSPSLPSSTGSCGT